MRISLINFLQEKYSSFVQIFLFWRHLTNLLLFGLNMSLYEKTLLLNQEWLLQIIFFNSRVPLFQKEQQLKDIKKQIHEEQRFHDDEIQRHEVGAKCHYCVNVACPVYIFLPLWQHAKYSVYCSLIYVHTSLMLIENIYYSGLYSFN